MSVQLIVYPQSYDGYSSVISTSINEFIVDGINFTTVNTSTDHTVTLPNGTQEAIDFYNPTLPFNTWKRFHRGSSGVTATTLLSINTSAAGQQQGILQKLSNLTIGAVYNITLDISTIIDTTNAFGIWIYSGTILQSVAPITTATGIQTITFSASSVSDTIVIVGDSTISQSLALDSISITNSNPVPTGAIQIVGDGQVICDLYEDEDLPLTLSVDDFKNVAEKVQSYSKAFNLPSTKRNNKIFNAIFEVTRENDRLIFNPYKKTKCVLKQDGFILFEGYLRMLDVTDKEGEISYNVNLYSEVIALADTLKDRAFRDLDFSELEHDYNYTNIVLSETGNLALTNPLPVGSFAGSAGSTITNVVRYPFVDWNHQYTITNGGMPKLLTLESSFRPFISIKYLIDRIFEASEFTYESAFFNTTDFGKLYMDFNWGGDLLPAPTNEFNSTWVFGTGAASNIGTGSFKELRLIPNGVTGGQTASTVPPNYDTSTYIITATTTNEIYDIGYAFKLAATTGLVVAECQWVHTTAAGVVSVINYQSISSIITHSTYAGSLQVTLQTGDTLKAQFKGTTDIRQNEVFISYVQFRQSSINLDGAGLLTLRGELEQWGFLKGLITMFNLVTLVDEDNPNNILIEPYVDVFIPTATGGTTLADRGIEHDWTDKIDVSEIKLTPLTDLNRKTIFKFVEDDDDYAFNNYKNLVGGHLYGSKKFNAGNEFNILAGEDEIVAEPFAATVVKPLMSQYPEFIVPVIYAMGEDGVSEGFDNSPRIMYNNGQNTLSSNTFSVPAQNGSPANAFANTFLQFSHLTDIPTITSSPPASTDTRDFHFGECQLMPGVGVATPNNLFNLYWLPYYSELYNPNTRTMTMKVNLSPADINTFRFNDRVFIKNRVFRVNKIDYKPNDLATVEFILIP